MIDPTGPEESRTTVILEGVRVHNLKSISTRFPLHRLTVVTGVSGSGKSSLAFDTLYAESQRRYIESISPYARQFLERLEKPDADRIDNLPPAVALRQNSVAPGRRSTVATATELYDYLRLLFARVGRIIDPDTGQEIRRDSPDSVAAVIEQFVGHPAVLIAVAVSDFAADDIPEGAAFNDRLIDAILECGLTRVVAGGRIVHLGRDERPLLDNDALIVVDRIHAGRTPAERVLESLETTFEAGNGRCILILKGKSPGPSIVIDGEHWTRLDFDRRLISPQSGRLFTEPSPPLFSFRSPLGACLTCRGVGSVPVMSWGKLVPDRSKSLRDGAIIAWTTPAYRHELDELLALADDYDLPVDVPFADLELRHRALIEHGVPERQFGGLRGFFRWLERKRYKIGVATFLARFRDYETCDACRGSRLNADAAAVQIAGRNIADVCRDTIAESQRYFDVLTAESLAADPAVVKAILPEIRSRQETLVRLGLGYLTLDRPTDTLSGGEARRIALTAAIGANLVNMLYVLDEPSTGLHPRDRAQVADTLVSLRDAPNTVVVVEHDPLFLESADWVVDLGPGAGRDGGQILYAGPVAGLTGAAGSITARQRDSATAGSAGGDSARAPEPPSSTLTLGPCRRHNLKDLTVAFPLQRLCVVSGVSGSGKSTLVTETLYPALCRALNKPCDLQDVDRFAEVRGADRLDDVVLIDQTPIGRTSRSNPATSLGIFDPIRSAFAATPEARLRAFGPGVFSFNTERGGRCPHCRGAGVVTIDMQFLPDIEVTCPECGGTRFRRDVLDVKLRGRSIAEVLDMTAAEAFAFFRGTPKVQRRLAMLKEVGLDYLPLGQPAPTLSGGESQRLKIASFLGGGTGKRTLFLFDEPTVGLHAADVARLLDCFRRLISVGHSLIVIEHRLDVLRAADWIIDLGPEAGDAGGHLVAAGPPQVIAAESNSITGRFLKR